MSDEPIKVRLVEVGDYVSGVVVAVRPGELDMKVERGLYRPGTIVTVKVKLPAVDKPPVIGQCLNPKCPCHVISKENHS